MRPTLFIAAFIMVFAVAATNAHADEYGDRFTGKAPPALGDYQGTGETPDILVNEEKTAEELQKILPASGDEAPAQEEEKDEKKPVK